VYGDNKDYIEADVIRGYVETGAARRHSIVSYYPQGANVHYNEMDIPNQEYFDERIDPSSDWEVSFYRSISKVDGLLMPRGGPSTLIAGQIVLRCNKKIAGARRPVYVHFNRSELL
jgi:hypothetical protein